MRGARGRVGAPPDRGATTRSMTSPTLKGGRDLVPSLLTSPPIWRAVFAQCQAMCLFSRPFLTHGMTVFQMIHFSRRLDVGGIEKASGGEANCHEKRSSAWSEGMSFRQRIPSFEKDGRPCWLARMRQGRLLTCHSVAGVYVAGYK